ncbi:hypothetical protein GQ457_08G024730 [Hibiscus cannabinus]
MKTTRNPPPLLTAATTSDGRFRCVRALDGMPRLPLSPHRVNGPRTSLELNEMELEPYGSPFVDLHRLPLDGATTDICYSRHQGLHLHRWDSPDAAPITAVRGTRNGVNGSRFGEVSLREMMGAREVALGNGGGPWYHGWQVRTMGAELVIRTMGAELV